MVKYTLFCESGDMNIGILTISDKGSQGQRQDKSGEAIRDIVTTAGSKVVKYEIIPDEKDVIAATLRDWADGGRADVILTKGRYPRGYVIDS
jgi:molybdopterin adenylyltransferase